MVIDHVLFVELEITFKTGHRKVSKVDKTAGNKFLFEEALAQIYGSHTE